MTSGFCLMWIITTLILCPGGTVVYLHVTFSIIPCCVRQGLNTHQGLPAMSLHPAEKHGCLQLYESLEWRCWNPGTGDQHEVIVLWAKEAWEALSLAHCGSLKGPASKALRKESLGKFAERGNKVSCLIRTDPCTFCSRNVLETLYKAEPWAPPRPFKVQSLEPTFFKNNIILLYFVICWIRDNKRSRVLTLLFA